MPVNIDRIQQRLSGGASDGNPRAREQPQLRIRLDRCNTLRAVAILGVFTYHIFSTLVPQSSQSFSAAISQLWAPLRILAELAVLTLAESYHLVIIFFVISGYFLHQAFLRWRRRNPEESLFAFTRFFLWRRIWRLIVPFWFALLLCYFLAYHHPFEASSLRKLAVNATLFKTLVPGYFFSINYAHWYIAVQWQLDLLYPFFLYITLRRSFLGAFTLACSVAFVFTFVVPHFTSAAYIFNLPFRWWAEWSVGAFLAEMHARNRRVFTHPWWSGLVCAVGLSAALGLRSEMIAWVFLRVAIILVLEVCLLSRSPLKQVERWMAPIGLCSYSMYLLHLPLIVTAVYLFKRSGLPINAPTGVLFFSLFTFALTFACSWAAYRYVEEPSVELGGRVWRKLFLNHSVAPTALAGSQRSTRSAVPTTPSS